MSASTVDKIINQEIHDENQENQENQEEIQDNDEKTTYKQQDDEKQDDDENVLDTTSDVETETMRLMEKNTIKPIFRYEFTKPFIEMLSAFSIKHHLNDRQTYKMEWEKWIATAEISELIEKERAYLLEIGYTGNIDDKMFKSGRYYFRKKGKKCGKMTGSGGSYIHPQPTPIELLSAMERFSLAAETEDNDEIVALTVPPTTITPLSTTTPPSEKVVAGGIRKKYLNSSKGILNCMDEHIKKMYESSPATFTPAGAYKTFCELNGKLINEEMEMILRCRLRMSSQDDDIHAAVAAAAAAANDTVATGFGCIGLDAGSSSNNKADVKEKIQKNHDCADLVDEISKKIKKTFKNRYFLYARNISSSVQLSEPVVSV